MAGFYTLYLRITMGLLNLPKRKIRLSINTCILETIRARHTKSVKYVTEYLKAIKFILHFLE